MAETGAPAAGSVAPAAESQAITNQPAGAGSSQAGNDTGNAIKDAAKEAARKFKVKVDGQDLEVDEGELVKGYAHAKAAAKRFQEGSKAKQQAEQFIKMMKDRGTLFDTLKKLGHDPRALAEEYLAEQIKEEMMDPKDRELKTTQQKLKEFEAKEAKRQEEIKQQEHDRLKSKYAKEFEATFIDALKSSGLPQTKLMVAEMAKYVKRAADIGYQLAPADAAKLVREDEEARLAAIAANSDAEVLAKLLGEKTLEKFRAYEAQKLKDPNANLQTPPDQNGERRKRDTGAKRMTPAEWRAFNRS